MSWSSNAKKGDVMGDGRTRVLIIGGGFEGVFAAQAQGVSMSRSRCLIALPATCSAGCSTSAPPGH